MYYIVYQMRLARADARNCACLNHYLESFNRASVRNLFPVRFYLGAFASHAQIMLRIPRFCCMPLRAHIDTYVRTVSGSRPRPMEGEMRENHRVPGGKHIS